MPVRSPFFASLLVSVALAVPAYPDAARQPLVDVRSACPGVRVELRYATARNGAGRVLYPPGSRCLLRKGVAVRLLRVQKRLEASGLGLKVWDAYRPPSAQKALWAVRPDKRFVAPPSQGSKHNRGAALDLTLVDASGRELPMPSGFDSFTPSAHSRYTGGTEQQRRNREKLRAAMKAQGFVPSTNEWWHFHAPDWRSYPLTEVPLRSARSARPHRPGHR